ncbi:hypothetical protein B0H10DRAFT_1953614 [Mycena sp. CBHHK59/15]|nr:hypothetical protein B0H10DRAFT_1953614 [Mycena sp. CBHHK59/15]
MTVTVAYLHFRTAQAKQLYRRMKGHPGNKDTREQKKTKETEVSKVFKQYLTGTGDFGDFDSVEWEAPFENINPIQVWEVFAGSSALAELADFAITILQIVANQAGNLTIATNCLLRNREVDEDQNDEDPSEHGCTLVLSAEGWRTQAAKWIGNAKAAERAEWENEDNNAIPNAIPSEEATPRVPNHIPVWKPITLQVLFSGAEKPRTRKLSPQVMEEEEMLMQQLAEDAEDEVPDNGTIEIL